MKLIDKKSKMLAFLLRHDKDYTFMEGGWRTVEDLVKNHKYTKEDLETIVSNDEKGRYEFNDTHTLIRARQGHSVNVDVDLEEKLPPEILYHGTATRFVESIDREGLSPMTRQYVHLSSNIETATKVGKRHGEPFIYAVNTSQMSKDGFKFFLSRNGVWLTKEVPSKYLNKY